MIGVALHTSEIEGNPVIGHPDPPPPPRSRNTSFFGVFIPDRTSTSNSGPAADTADSDQDGLVNLLEFALALNPTASSVVPVQSGRNSGSFKFTYTRSKAALSDGVLYFVEWSDDLKSGSWTSEGVTSLVLEESELIQIIEATVPPGPEGKRFVRLRVTGN